MPSNRVYLSYNDAKQLIQQVQPKISNQKKFQEWSKSDRPSTIPSNPAQFYTDFVSWNDFLGTDNKCGWAVAPSKRQVSGRRQEYLSYEDATAYVSNLNLDGVMAYRVWAKTQRPAFIPSNPSMYYADSWVSWKSYLGTENTMSYDEAVSIVRSVEPRLTNRSEFEKWVKTTGTGVPSRPHTHYDEWTSWGDFLDSNWLSFDDAKRLVQSVTPRITNRKQFDAWLIATGVSIPKAPQYTYTEWVDWFDFLGKVKIDKTRTKE